MATSESCCTCATLLTPPSNESRSDSLLFSKLSADTARTPTNRPVARKLVQQAEDLPPSYATPDSSIQSLRSLTVAEEREEDNNDNDNDDEDEDQKPQQRISRHLPCCNRQICIRCLTRNPRFESYCPFCQVSSKPTALPQGGLRDPPGYESLVTANGVSKGESQRQRQRERQQQAQQEQQQNQRTSKPTMSEASKREDPPSYTDATQSSSSSSQPTTSDPENENETENGEDTIHFLHSTDTLTSLSLSYNVPVQVIKSHNQIWTDTLLAARRTILIPSSHYKGPSLSDKPIESEEEAARKASIRGFMMRTKCHDYELAELYLDNAGGDVDGAVDAWEGDERWERENPLKNGGSMRKLRGGPDKAKGRGGRGGLGGGLTGQLR